MIAALLLTTVLAADPSPEQLDLLKTFHAEFIAVTPGEGVCPATFTLGDDTETAAKPAHPVTFKHRFSMAKYEVPQNLWEAVMGSNPSKWKGKRNSVEMLTFDEAVKFCQTTTDLMRAAKLIGDDETIRLPSEAEWEYCARAGTKTKFSFGDDVSDLGKHGWFNGNAAGNDPPVGAKAPNAWGFYDMHGYLWEWCTDSWHDSYAGAPADGSSWNTGGDDMQRVLRSGSWKDKAPWLASAVRRSAPRKLLDDAVGLRCVLVKK
jgi:formylglycine-generating enzyme required for sulfatase activity